MPVLSTATSSGPYVGNGSTTVFPFYFAARGVGEIIVIADGVVVDSSLYIVALSDAGGSVTFLAAPVAASIYIDSNPDFTQQTLLGNHAAFLPDVIGTALDRAAIRDLYLLNGVSRSLRASRDETLEQLPNAALRAGMFQAYDAVGQPVMASGTGNDGALRTDLAEPRGSAFVGYQSAGTGAVVRTVADKLGETISVKDFGAVGDGVADDAGAITAAIAAVSSGGSVILPPGIYNVKSAIPVSKSVSIYGFGATVRIDAAFSASSALLANAIMAFAVTGSDATITGVAFDGNSVNAPISGNIAIVWGTAARLKLPNCTAFNVGTAPGLQVAFGSSITSSEFTVQGCRFDNCPGSAFSQGARPLFQNNRVTNPRDISFALNSQNCIGGIVSNNSIDNASGSTVSGHILMEEGASAWSVTENTIRGVKNGTAVGTISITITTVVEGGIIANNTIDGGGFTTTGASALISVSGYYANTNIEGNKLSGMPAGLSSNAAITIVARGTTVRGNRIDATSGTGSTEAILITPATGDAYVSDNDIDCTGGAIRHIIVSSGDGGGGKLFIKGGNFIGGSEGINFNLGMPTNFGLWIENISEITATNPLAVSTALPAFGDRQFFFDTYSTQLWPHWIKQHTVMYGTNAPTAGTWAVGDEVICTAVALGAPDRWRCTVAGTPGTWKAGAILT